MFKSFESFKKPQSFFFSGLFDD